TCTEDLVITYECTVCSGTYTETTEAPGHNWLITEKGDCTGVTIIKSCTVCSVTETSTGEPKSHNLVSTRHEATDISVGYTEFTCSTCGYSYNVYDAHDCATQGHIGPETDRVRSCTELTIYCVCSVCEESFSLVDDTGGLGHDLVETSSSGLCTSRSVTYSCQRSGCDHTETRTEVRSHSYVQTDWQGPCDQAVVTYTCSTCGDSYTESSPGSHAYEETARTDATCTAEGSITYTCSSCNATKLEAIPILEHDMQLVGFETSCTERTDTYECSMCGYTEQRAGTPLGHSWTITNTTEDGYRIKTYTCQICGHVEEERTALPKVPETTVEDVERFVLNFFGSIASFFLYILANISFLGITGLDLLAILAIVAFVVLIRKITSGGD
ncbi:MAG: hypothetical protein IJY12_02770, partial [Clostridia bacterium]|nr:hypothetical protein [Clostridia bacterium]